MLKVKYKPSKTQKENLKYMWRNTFEQFLMINKGISAKLAEEMIGNDLEIKAQNLVLECKKQWEERKGGEAVSGKVKLPEQKFHVIPNTWCKLLNSQVTPCPKRRKPGLACSSWYIKRVHGIELKDVQDIWKDDISGVTQLDKKIKKNK